MATKMLTEEQTKGVLFAPRRSTSTKDLAQRREYARNYAKIRKAIGKVLHECWDQADGNQFSDSINTTVRELVGCRITSTQEIEHEGRYPSPNAIYGAIDNALDEEQAAIDAVLGRGII